MAILENQLTLYPAVISPYIQNQSLRGKEVLFNADTEWIPLRMEDPIWKAMIIGLMRAVQDLDKTVLVVMFVQKDTWDHGHLVFSIFGHHFEVPPLKIGPFRSRIVKPLRMPMMEKATQLSPHFFIRYKRVCLGIPRTLAA